MAEGEQVLIASYRGPIEAGPSGPKGAGGLIQVLQPWAEEHGAQWVFAGAEGQQPSDDGLWMPLKFDELPGHQHYGIISNSILWPLFHGLEGRAIGKKDLGDPDFTDAWEGYRQVNAVFADRIAEQAATDAIVVVHDYQLLLVPGMVRALRTDLHVGYFHHIPFAKADELGRLPDSWRKEIVSSLAGGPSGFQSPRWVELYRGCCTAAGASDVTTFVAPVGANLDGLRKAVDAQAVRGIRAEVRDEVGEMQLIARVDRADPMKNVLTGVKAVDVLLEEHPEWIEQFVFAHHLVPTRSTVPGYREHLDEILEEVEAVNRKWARGDWAPIDIKVLDQRERGLALMCEYDVVLVNPIREGMNLIAHEGPAVNTRDGVLVLSREAGSYDTFSDAALGIDPLSEEDTATGLHRALSMPQAERQERAERLKRHLEVDFMETWHDDIVAAVA
jgi:trehalose 6-phosphate synthase